MITTTYICSNCHSVMDGDAATVDWHVASGECADVRTAAEEQDDEYGVDGLPLSGRPLDGDGR